jgi:hypothetical protein
MRRDEADRVDDPPDPLGSPAPLRAQLLIVHEIAQRGVLDLFRLICDQQDLAIATSSMPRRTSS